MLKQIVERKKEEVAGLRRQESALRGEAEASLEGEAGPRRFEAALRREGEVALIAEMKRRSPSAGWIRPDVEVEAVVAAYAGAGASALSILTDRDFFGGDLEDLRRARQAVELPLLRKDFMLDPVQVWEARAAGADAILLIVRILDAAQLEDLLAVARELDMAALVEIHAPRELDRALHAGATIVGVNHRDLDSFETHLGMAVELAPEIPPESVLVAESGIRTGADVDRLGEAGIDAILVGESLLRSEDLAEATSALAGRPRRSRKG